MNNYDYYKNMRDDEAGEFDHAWGNAARSIGFPTSTAHNRLGYGSDNAHYNAPPRSHLNAVQYDDNRRGAYVDNVMRNEY